MTGQDILLRLLSVLLLIAINAFFVAAEFSIVSVRRSRISQLVEAGDIQAQTVQSLQQSIDRLLSTTQIGITLSSLALGWIGESTMAVLVRNFLIRLPLPKEVTVAISHSVAIPIAFLLIAYLQIVLGELCPKSVALLYSEELARFFGPSSLVISRCFNPFVWLLNQSTRFLLRLVGIQYTGQGWYHRVTPEELQLIITTEQESMGLEAEERELLNNVFEFGEVMAAEIMVPRTNIKAIAYTAPFAKLVDKVAKIGYPCHPVIGDSLDDIRGIICFQDLASPWAEGLLKEETPIGDWVKPTRFVPEVTPLSELLPLMQRAQLEMVIVVDEFGGTSGIVTREDLIAEIIGDGTKELNSEQVELQLLDERTFLVQAQMNLEDVNELLDLNLPLIDEYQTLGGFLLYQFQKIPAQGEMLHYGNLDLTVVSADGPKLYQIRIHQREHSTKPGSATDSVVFPKTIDVDLDLNNHNS